MQDHVWDPSLKIALQEMDSFDFEHFIADLWERRGWKTAVSKQSSDRGVDITAIQSDDGFQTKAVIQAKRFQSGNSVGRPKIQQYASLKQQEDADIVVVVTTSTFSNPAETSADDFNVKLVDINDLVSVIQEEQADDLLEQYDLVERDDDEPDDEDNSNKEDEDEENQIDEELHEVNSTEVDSIERSETERIVNPRPAEIGLSSGEAWGIWGKGIVVSTALLLLCLIAIVGLSAPESTPSIVLALIYIASTIWLIVSIYKDATNLHDSSLNWKPTRTVYILAVILSSRILLGFLVGVIYLLVRRWKVTYPRLPL